VAEQLFFGLGIANNLFLILIFLTRKAYGIAGLERIGKWYYLLAIPAVYGMVLVHREHKAVQYAIFLGIFLAFLSLEWAFDFAWKVPFRQNWALLTPYLCLYYAMNYGFVVMPWKTSLTRGIIMLGLFVIQMTANIATHGYCAAPR
jgi:hypothetical protein